jgi:hypothetical protein
MNRVSPVVGGHACVPILHKSRMVNASCMKGRKFEIRRKCDVYEGVDMSTF